MGWKLPTLNRAGGEGNQCDSRPGPLGIDSSTQANVPRFPSRHARFKVQWAGGAVLNFARRQSRSAGRNKSSWRTAGAWRRAKPQQRGGFMSYMRRIVAATVLAVCALTTAHAQWQPSKNVELIAPAAAGSALDSLARVLQRVIQDKRLVTSNITVIDKAGGGNAVGFTYLAPRAGDAHYLLVTPFTIITNRIIGANPLSYQDFTPLAMLAEEHIGFVVNINSPIKTGRDLLDRLKKDPESVSMALAAALGKE